MFPLLTGDCKDEDGVMDRCVAGAINNYTSQLLTYGNAPSECKKTFKPNNHHSICRVLISLLCCFSFLVLYFSFGHVPLNCCIFTLHIHFDQGFESPTVPAVRTGLTKFSTLRF